jgi:hypothetical protein
MRPVGWLIALALGMGIAVQTGPAAAETLNLLCRVHETRADGAHRDVRRRLEIDLQTKVVRFYDDVGHGWRFKNQYPYLSADADRIRLESGGGKESYVDRRTGTYVFRNQKTGLTIRGPCERVAAGGPRF